MRRLTHVTTAIATAAAALALSAGAVAATSVPPATEPDAGTARAELSPVDDTIAVDPAVEPTVIVDGSGSPIARVSVLGIDPDWADYGEWDTPRAGYQYVRVTVVIESLAARGLFEVADRDFALQDVDGFLFAGDVVATAEQDAAGEDVVDDAALVNGESVQLELTFEVVAGAAPAALFYFPGYDRLVTIADLSA